MCQFALEFTVRVDGKQPAEDILDEVGTVNVGGFERIRRQKGTSAGNQQGIRRFLRIAELALELPHEATGLSGGPVPAEFVRHGVDRLPFDPLQHLFRVFPFDVTQPDECRQMSAAPTARIMQPSFFLPTVQIPFRLFGT